VIRRRRGKKIFSLGVEKKNRLGVWVDIYPAFGKVSLLSTFSMDTKRIRFGFVCENTTSFFAADTLPSLHIKTIECALSNDKQYVIFTVESPIRASDVLKAVDVFNATPDVSPLTLVKFMDGDIIITFEKGQRFLQHPFYAVIHEAKCLSQNEADGEPSPPPRVWEWSFDGVPVSHRYKRMSGELASALVQDSISPSSVKRAKGVKTAKTVDDPTVRFFSIFYGDLISLYTC